MITISVPTQTYLKKYALFRCNSQNGHIEVTTTHSYGVTLLKVLEKKASWEPKQKLKGLEDTLSFKISEFYYSHAGFYLSKQNFIFLNEVIQSDFEDALFQKTTENVQSKIKTTIEDEIAIYLQFYGITETDKSMESLLKAYQRWRNRRNYLVIKV